jgi:hypothetical protein
MYKSIHEEEPKIAPFLAYAAEPLSPIRLPGADINILDDTTMIPDAY